MEKKGIKILERNFRSRFGEIDIIGRDGKYLVFFEVKYRKSSMRGYPEEAVGYGKIKTICKVSDYYRLIHHLGDDVYVRYDVLAVTDDEIRHVINAFDYI